MLCLDFHVLTFSHFAPLRSFIVLTLLFLCLFFFFLALCSILFDLHSLICILVLHFLNTPLCVLFGVYIIFLATISFCFIGAGYHHICEYSSISFTQFKEHITN